MKFFWMLGFILILGAVSFAAECSEKAYSSSCNKCNFDANGSLDKTCYERYQNNGVACLFTTYPVESIEYKMGNCPAVDTCKERLEECKALYSVGNDKDDCLADNINHCFQKADVCVDYAVHNCDKTPPGALENDLPTSAMCEDIWFFIALFAGALFIKRG